MLIIGLMKGEKLMNPKLKEFLVFIDDLKPKLEQMGFVKTPSNVREAYANNHRRYMTDIDYTVFALDDFILNDEYPVCFRMYIPNPMVASEIIFFVHGGGHMCGSVAQYDGITRKIAKQTNKIVISIDYRLSPEFRYPTGLDDCKTVINKIYPILDKHKIKYISNNVTLIGDSGGGALCASISADRDFVLNNNITKQVLIYPSLDYTMTSKSLDKYATGYYLEKATIEWYFSHYCPHINDRKSISPLYSKFYLEMPKSLIITAEFDPLVDDGNAYYNELLAHKIEAEYLEIKETIHAFLSLENICVEACELAYKSIANFV